MTLRGASFRYKACPPPYSRDMPATTGAVRAVAHCTASHLCAPNRDTYGAVYPLCIVAAVAESNVWYVAGARDREWRCCSKPDGDHCCATQLKATVRFYGPQRSPATEDKAEHMFGSFGAMSCLGVGEGSSRQGWSRASDLMREWLTKTRKEEVLLAGSYVSQTLLRDMGFTVGTESVLSGKSVRRSSPLGRSGYK